MAVSSHQFLVCTICHHRVYRHHPSDVRTPGDGQCPQCGANMIPYSPKSIFGRPWKLIRK